MPTHSPSILVIEDDPQLCQTFQEVLEGEGYQVTPAATAAAARAAIEERPPELVLMDLVLPDADGLILCADVKSKLGVPIVVVSGTIRKRDSVLALKLGADDFIPKPFDVDVLLSRVDAALRRSRSTEGPPVGAARHPAIAAERPPMQFVAQRASHEFEPVSTVGPLTLERARKRVTFDGVDVALTPTEYRLLSAFMTRPDEVLSRRDLAQLVWGYEDASIGRSIDVHVHRLRMKLQRAQEEGGRAGPSLISVRGFGYKLLSGAARAVAA